jgi:hypothetical protein
MPVRKAHGRAKAAGRTVVVETNLKDLPRGVPAPLSPAAVRDPRKRFEPLTRGSPEAHALALKASRAATEKRNRIKALKDLGFPDGPPEWLGAYVDAAREFCDRICADLAQHVGGGGCPTYAAVMVQNAALALAASRAAYTIGDDPALAARLADSARTQVLTAWELAARGARAKGPPGAKATEAVLARYFPEAGAR